MRVRQLAALLGVVVATGPLAPAAAGAAPADTEASASARAALFGWRPVGEILAVDVPRGLGVLDLNPLRAGPQTLVAVLHHPGTHRLRVSTLLGRVLAEGPDGGFTPRATLGAGWRAFVWGEQGGSPVLWTPAFDSARALASVEPELPCGSAGDTATPLAGPFDVTIPAGAKPGGKAVPSPTSALVYGSPAGGVRVATAGGIALGQAAGATNVARGGFSLAGAAFAYGEAGGKPVLWSPELLGRSTDLERTPFLACTEPPSPPAEGTITVAKELVPATDPGRFDLLVDGAVRAAGAGDAGTTGPVSLPVGEHAVSEASAPGTSLDGYDATIECVEDTNAASPLTAAGTSLGGIPVEAGDAWACTITNTIDITQASVASAPDTARESTATIGRLGGTVEATSADGVRYRLDVPEGALAADTRITMAPAAVSGLESLAEDVLGAVELGPSGLRFLLPARLTITPPPGTTIDLLHRIAVAFDGEASGLEILELSLAPDAVSVSIAVEHFSGVASVEAREAFVDQVVAASLAAVPSFASLAPQARALAARLPGTEAELAALLGQLYAEHVVPALERASESVEAFAFAEELLRRWAGQAPLLALESIPSGQGGMTLEELTLGGFARLATEGEEQVAGYEPGAHPTACSAQVTELADWFVRPAYLEARLSFLQDHVLHPLAFCPTLDAEVISFPDVGGGISNVLPLEQRFVNLTFQVIVAAPSGTPGGRALPDGRRAFGEPAAQIALEVQGASDAFDGQTDAEGTFSATLDRGADEASRPPRVSIDASGEALGFWTDVAVRYGLETAFALHVEAGPPAAVNMELVSQAEGRILAPGGVSEVCVQLEDAAGSPVANANVIFTLAGFGALSAPAARTNGAGGACVGYVHPPGPVPGPPSTDPTEPFARVTAETAGPTGSPVADSIELFPRWARLALDVHAEPQAILTTPVGQDPIPVPGGERIVVRATLTGPGATPADSPVPIALDQARFQIESGPGSLVSPLGATGSDLAVTTDASGRGQVTWVPPANSTQGVTLRVSYPLNGAGIAASVVLEPASSRVTLANSGSGEPSCHYAQEGDTEPAYCIVNTWNQQGTFFVEGVRLPDGSIRIHATGSFTGMDSASGGPGCNPIRTESATDLAFDGVLPADFLPLSGPATIGDSCGNFDEYVEPNYTVSIPYRLVTDGDGNPIALDFATDSYQGRGTITGYVVLS